MMGVWALGVIGARVRSKAPAAVGAVLASMAAHRGSAPVAACGCEALPGLLPETKPAASAARAAIMEAMRSHPGDRNVQANACAALDVLLHDVDSTLQEECGVAGAPQLLVAALNTYTYCDVVENSCLALEALVHGHKANTRLAVRAGGIEALLAVIQMPYPADTPPSERRVPSRGLAALAALVHKLPASDATACVIEPVVDVMRQYADDADVQQDGCSAIRRICRSSAALQERAWAAGALEVAAALLLQHGLPASAHAEAARLHALLAGPPAA
jgi:hypothetical protein